MKNVPKNNWNLIWGIPLVLLYLFCYLAPVWGTAAISVSRFHTYRQPADERIALAGILFIFALALLVVSVVHWVVTGRRRNGFYQVQAWLALVLGVLSAAAVRMYGLNESVNAWQTWIIPIVGSSVLGAVFLVLMLVRRLSQDAPDGTAAFPRNKAKAK